MALRERNQSNFIHFQDGGQSLELGDIGHRSIVDRVFDFLQRHLRTIRQGMAGHAMLPHRFLQDIAQFVFERCMFNDHKETMQVSTLAAKMFLFFSRQLAASPAWQPPRMKSLIFSNARRPCCRAISYSAPVSTVGTTFNAPSSARTWERSRAWPNSWLESSDISR